MISSSAGLYGVRGRAAYAASKGAMNAFALTLADDRGSGKLRAWYEELGFVGAEEFGDTAMVARVE